MSLTEAGVIHTMTEPAETDFILSVPQNSVETVLVVTKGAMKDAFDTKVVKKMSKRIERMPLSEFQKNVAKHLFVALDPTIQPYLNLEAYWCKELYEKVKKALHNGGKIVKEKRIIDEDERKDKPKPKKKYRKRNGEHAEKEAEKWEGHIITISAIHRYLMPRIFMGGIVEGKEKTMFSLLLSCAIYIYKYLPPPHEKFLCPFEFLTNTAHDLSMSEEEIKELFFSLSQNEFFYHARDGKIKLTSLIHRPQFFDRPAGGSSFIEFSLDESIMAEIAHEGEKSFTFGEQGLKFSESYITNIYTMVVQAPDGLITYSLDELKAYLTHELTREELDFALHEINQKTHLDIDFKYNMMGDDAKFIFTYDPEVKKFLSEYFVKKLV